VGDDVWVSQENKGWVIIELSSNNTLPEVPVVLLVFALVEIIPSKRARALQVYALSQLLPQVR
jgi:hypothetical protein